MSIVLAQDAQDADVQVWSRDVYKRAQFFAEHDQTPRLNVRSVFFITCWSHIIGALMTQTLLFALIDYTLCSLQYMSFEHHNF